MALPRGFSTAATLVLVALLAASLLPASHARKDVLISADDASATLPASASADAAVSNAASAAASAAAGGASGVEAITDMFQRQGPRILNVESYMADEPLPEHLQDLELHRRELQSNGPLADNCGRTTLRIAQKYLGVFYQKNYLFNITMINKCKYSLLSPLILFGCIDFGNLMEGSLDNPARNPTPFQRVPVFDECCATRFGRGNCQIQFNQGPRAEIFSSSFFCNHFSFPPLLATTMALSHGLRGASSSVELQPKRTTLLAAAPALALIALLATSLLPAAHARRDALSSADDASATSSALPASASADSAISAAGSAAGDGASGVEAIADMFQRQGPRILNVESYMADEPLPEHLQDLELHRRELQSNGPLASNCGRTTLRIAQKYLGVFYQKNYMFNITMVNKCKYSLLSPLILFGCIDFGNLMEGSLDNPARNPTPFQRVPVFDECCATRFGRGNCQIQFNQGPRGNVQLYPGQAVSFLYAWNKPMWPCARELHFANGDTYFMPNEFVGTECTMPILYGVGKNTGW
ncbi:unnamed protein product [Closterium sp. Yama58-4]|nr:unnamed protein product [Closterium sp. Yama58-4]